MRKIFIPNLEEMKKYNEEVLNDKNFLFCVENDEIHIYFVDCGKKALVIRIFIDAIDTLECSLEEKYSILNELLNQFDLGLRYSKKRCNSKVI